MVIGMPMGSTTCVPLPTPPSPEVTGPVDVPVPGVPAEPPPITELSPITETAVSSTVTGMPMGATTWVPEPTPSVPSVDGPPVVPGAGAAGAAASVPSVVLSPMTETAVSPTVTGIVMGATTWVPESMPSEPPVVGAPVEPPETGAAGPDELSLVLSPMTETAASSTVTGTVMGATTCVPEPMPSVPSVEGAPVVPVAGAVGAATSVLSLVLSPMTETAVSPTVTGTVIGATTCEPERIPSEPPVVGAAVEPLGAGAVGVAASVDSVVLSPMTEIAVSSTVTGTVMGATTWVPEPTPSVPSVDGASAGSAGAGAGAAGAASVDSVVLSPTTETAVSFTVIGTLTSTSACDPEAAPSAPLVDPDEVSRG